MYNSIEEVRIKIDEVYRLYNNGKISNDKRIKELSYLMACHDFLKHAQKKENQKVKTR